MKIIWMQVLRAYILLLLLVAESPMLFAQVFEEKQVTAGNMRLTVNNLGGIGNAFKGSYDDPSLKYSSCEFPAGSNIEHIFEGGLWIGAKVNGTYVTSTTTVDEPSGYSLGKAGFEFTPSIGSIFYERSSKLDNPTYYHPEAISHQDIIADYTDSNIKIPGTDILIEDLENGPLFTDVHFESYNWNFSFANYFSILTYEIVNNSTNVWEDVHLGFWVDPVVRNTLVTTAGAGGKAFYDKGGSGYIEDSFIAYEFDANGDPGYTDSYVGVKFLGSEYNGQLFHPSLDTAFHINYNSWSFRDFESGYRTPANDIERYEKLQTSLTSKEDWLSYWKPFLKKPGNRSLMISAGPYESILPGERVVITFAIVCAKKFDDGNPTTYDTESQKQNLIYNANWAQTAYNGEDKNENGVLDPDEDNNKDGKLTRYILPEPPPPPRDTFIVGQHSVKIYWADNAESFIDPITRKKDFEGYRIYKTNTSFDTQASQDLFSELKMVAQFDREEHSGFISSEYIEADNGFKSIRLDEPVIFPDDTTKYRYLYEMKNLPQGWQQAIVVTAFDYGDREANLESLESSLVAFTRKVFPGTKINENFKNGDPYVYPNPFYAKAKWEGYSNAEEDKKIIFANLPSSCEIKVYNVAGDLIDEFRHDANENNTNETRWFDSYASIDESQKRVFSGGEHAWNMLSKDNQIIARGIYVFAVKDLNTGEIRNGKFVIIK